MKSVAIVPLSNLLSGVWLKFIEYREEVKRLKELAITEFREKAHIPRSSAVLDAVGLDDAEEDDEAVDLKLDPFTKTYVVDVGTGEMGFYVFHQVLTDVKMIANKKYSFAKGQGFMKQFYRDPHGAQEFAKILCEKFDNFAKANVDDMDQIVAMVQSGRVSVSSSIAEDAENANLPDAKQVSPGLQKMSSGLEGLRAVSKDTTCASGSDVASLQGSVDEPKSPMSQSFTSGTNPARRSRNSGYSS